MRTTPSFLLALGLAGYAAAQDCSTVCQSFGSDFVDGGSYFQNIQSTENFTAFEYFTGCQDDVANNILTSPDGDQWECDLAPMTPSNTNQLVTCPIQKDELTSGNWSIIVISNNGQCDPIDYIRQFSLSVGVQSTSTVFPTTTYLTTTTPIYTTYVTSTSLITSQAPPVTTTVFTGTQKTYTSTPKPTFTFTTKAIVTLTRTTTTKKVVATSTKTNNPCTKATGHVKDRINSAISVTVGPETVQTLANSLLADATDILKPRATPIARSGGAVIERHIIERTEVKMQRRHPDEPTTTVTETSSTATITQTSTAPTLSLTGTTTVLSTTTVTSTLTSVKGYTITTVTAPRKTQTITLWVPFTTTVTTRTIPVTQTTTTTVTAC